MRSISKAEIERIADLCCIDISSEPLTEYQNELANILTFIKQIDEIDTKDIEPMAHAAEISLRLRADKIVNDNLAKFKKRDFQTPVITNSKKNA